MEMTLACLRSLYSQQGMEAIDLTVYLVDDGSTDGTCDAVAANFAEVRLLHGNKQLYWNGGMRMAFTEAMREDFDAYLWLNDDSIFFNDAIKRMITCYEEVARQGVEAIIAGSMMDPKTRTRSYGGYRAQRKWLRFDWIPVPPDENRALSCDTMNGNLVLIPAAVAKKVGNLDATFRHQIGDLDYGLRARKAGVSVLIAPKYFGECTDNSREGTWMDRTLSRRKRWANLMSPKGAPPREWLLFTWRHYGWRWPLYAISPYLKTLVG